MGRWVRLGVSLIAALPWLLTASTFAELYPDFLLHQNEFNDASLHLNEKSFPELPLIRYLNDAYAGPQPHGPVAIVLNDTAVESVQGRSTEGPFTDIKNPRRLYVIINKNPDDPLFDQPMMYLAYTPKLDQLDVIDIDRSVPTEISYNFLQKTGLVQQPNAKVEMAPRYNCVACHQNQGPHFPRRDWSEFSRNASSYDPDVRRGANLLQASKLCRAFGRDGDLQKRKALLVLALLSNSMSHNDVGPNKNLEDFNVKQNAPTAAGLAKLFTSIWPADNFSVISSVLPDRSPTENTGTLFFSRYPDKSSPDRAISSGFEHYRQDGTFPGAVELGQTRLTVGGDHKALSPLTKRPLTHPISLDLLGLFNLKDLPLLEVCFGIRSKSIQNADLDFLKREILDGTTYDKVLAKWPTATPELAKLVDRTYRRFQTAGVDHLIQERLSEIEKDSGGSEVPTTHAPALINEYCADCHGPNGKKRMRLPLDKLRGFADSDGRTVDDYIASGDMPKPNEAKGSKQRPMTAAERAAVLKYLAPTDAQSKAQ